MSIFFSGVSLQPCSQSYESLFGSLLSPYVVVLLLDPGPVSQDTSLHLCLPTNIPPGFLDIAFLPSSPLAACCVLDLIPKYLQDYCCSGMSVFTDFHDGGNGDSE